MATQATVNARIDLNLRAIAAEIEDLSTIEAEWPHMLDDHKAAFLLEWDEMVARLENLDRAFRTAQMTSAQQSHFRELLRKLDGAAPIVERIGLVRPRLMQAP